MVEIVVVIQVRKHTVRVDVPIHTPDLEGVSDVITPPLPCVFLTPPQESQSTGSGVVSEPTAESSVGTNRETTVGSSAPVLPEVFLASMHPCCKVRTNLVT